MRAMREARYAEPSTRSTSASAPAKPVVRPAKRQSASPTVPAPSTDALCGHRSMNGRTCTRESGHAAKSHRYS